MDEKSVKVIEKSLKSHLNKENHDSLDCKNEKQCLENNILNQQFFPDDIDKSLCDFDFFYTSKDDFSDFDFITSNNKKENVDFESFDLGLNDYEDDERNVTKSTCIDFDYKDIADEEPIETDFLTLKNNLLQKEFKVEFDFLGNKKRKQSENVKSKLCLNSIYSEEAKKIDEVKNNEHDNNFLYLNEENYFNDDLYKCSQVENKNSNQFINNEEYGNFESLKNFKHINDSFENNAISNDLRCLDVNKLNSTSSLSTMDTLKATKNHSFKINFDNYRNKNTHARTNNNDLLLSINTNFFSCSLDSLKLKYKYNLFDFSAKLVLDIYDSFSNMTNYFSFNIKNILSLLLNNSITSTIVGLKVNQPIKLKQKDIFRITKIRETNDILSNIGIDSSKFNARNNEKVMFVEEIDLKPANIRQKLKKIANNKINVLLNSLIFILTSGRLNNSDKNHITDLDPHKIHNQSYFKEKLFEIIKNKSITQLLNANEALNFLIKNCLENGNFIYDYNIVSYELFRIIINMTYGELFQMYFSSDLFLNRKIDCNLKDYIAIEKLYTNMALGFNSYIFG